MKKVPYFSHDADARRGPKLTAIVKNYGMAGYGTYWVILEMLREAEQYRLPYKDFVFDAIASESKTEPSEAKKFIDELVDKFELLQSDKKFLWSESLNGRMKLMEEKSKQATYAAKERWRKEQCGRKAGA